MCPFSNFKALAKIFSKNERRQTTQNYRKHTPRHFVRQFSTILTEFAVTGELRGLRGGGFAKLVLNDAELVAASNADRNPCSQRLRSDANNDAKLALPIRHYGTTFRTVAHEHQGTQTQTLWHSDASAPKLQVSLYDQPSTTFSSHANINIL